MPVNLKKRSKVLSGVRIWKALATNHGTFYGITILATKFAHTPLPTIFLFLFLLFIFLTISGLFIAHLWTPSNSYNNTIILEII